jgi:hypothetical protein
VGNLVCVVDEVVVVELVIRRKFNPDAAVVGFYVVSEYDVV